MCNWSLELIFKVKLKLPLGNKKNPIHYCDVIMSVMTSQITTLAIVYSTIYSGADQTKLCVSGLCDVTGEFPTQMARDAENVSIWWRHHDGCKAASLKVTLLKNNSLLPRDTINVLLKFWANIQSQTRVRVQKPKNKYGCHVAILKVI